VFLRGGRGPAEQPEPPWRLGVPVLADGPSDALDQLLAPGLRPARLAPRSRAVRHVHRRLHIHARVTHLRVARLGGLQDRARLLDDHCNAPRSGAPRIGTIRRKSPPMFGSKFGL
jgi:hypothetical protein